MKIYLGNMPFTMSEDEIRTLFEEFGPVDSVSVITDRETGRPRGFAFVEMSDDNAARSAMEALDNKMVGGRTLKVNEARPRQAGGGGGGGGGRGGRRGGGGGGRWMLG